MNQYTGIEIPISWIQVPLSDLFLDPKNNIVDGPFGSNLKSSEYQDEGVPIIRIQNIDRNRFVDKNINYLTEDKADFLSRHSFQSGDIIITKLGEPVGKACLVPEKYERGIIVADLIRVRIDHNYISKKFLLYQLNSSYLIKQFDKNTKGTTRQRIRLNIVRDLIFNLPPLQEQFRIVDSIEELFSDLDNSVTNLVLAKNQLNVYRQALLKYAFEGKLTEQWRIKNHPESATKLLNRIKKERDDRYKKKLKDWKEAISTWEDKGKKEKKPRKPSNPKIEKLKFESELSEFWFYSSFESCVANLDGDRIPISRSIRSGKNGKYRYYGATGIIDYIDNFIFNGRFLLIGEDGANLLSKARDLAFIVEGKFWVNNHAHVLKTLYGMNIDFLCFYFNSLTLNDYVSGTAQPKLSQANLNKIPVPNCSIAEQLIIVNELESQFSVIDNLERIINDGIQKSETLRQSILKKAFNGKLVVQDTRDEPASKLLKHIQVEKEKYLEGQKLQEKKIPKKIYRMAKELSIEEVLKTSNKPMLGKDVWQQSKHKDNIEEFYTELKKIQRNIKEVKRGTESLTESLLTLTK